MKKLLVLLIIPTWLLLNFSVLLGAPGDPVVIETTSGDLLIGVEGDTPDMVLLMPAQIPYCVSLHETGLGMGIQDVQGECSSETDSFRRLRITNKYIIHKTGGDLVK